MVDLSEYLRKRGLILNPIDIEQDPVLETEGAAEGVAGLWEGHAPLIRMIIQARVNAIGSQLLKKAVPEEVPVLRQAFVEVGAIIDDFERYAAEARRRKSRQDTQTATTT